MTSTNCGNGPHWYDIKEWHLISLQPESRKSMRKQCMPLVWLHSYTHELRIVGMELTWACMTTSSASASELRMMPLRRLRSPMIAP